MDRELGRVDLINWQSRRSRAPRRGVGPWAAACMAGLVLGVILAAAQAAGWLRWTGPLAAAPAALVLVAVAGQIVAVTRAVLAWLAG